MFAALLWSHKFLPFLEGDRLADFSIWYLNPIPQEKGLNLQNMGDWMEKVVCVHLGETCVALMEKCSGSLGPQFFLSQPILPDLCSASCKRKFRLAQDPWFSVSFHEPHLT